MNTKEEVRAFLRSKEYDEMEGSFVENVARYFYERGRKYGIKKFKKCITKKLNDYGKRK